MNKKAITALWINNIIFGKKTFRQVPEGLKEDVKKALLKNGREDLL